MKKPAAWSLRSLSVVCLLLGFAGSCAPRAPDRALQVRNLRAFAKLYGYVRYFHPSDEAAALDWEALAIHGAGLVKEARSARALAKELRGLFTPVAPTVAVYLENEEAPDPLRLFPKATEGLVPVSWQHQGLGSGFTNSVYSSVRRNRVNTLNALTEGGVVTQVIDARPFRGREVRLKAFMRTDVRGLMSRAQLWLRVDRPNNQRGFFDNMVERPVRTKSWAEYEIKGPVADDAERFAFGAILNGHGGLWLDDVRLEVRTAGGDWKEVSVANAGFEEKGQDDLPAGWTTAVQGCLYRVVADNPHGGRCSLRLEGRQIPQPDRLFEVESRIGDVINKPLGAGLSCVVPLALWSDERTTLPPADTAALEKLAAALEDIASLRLTAENDNVRLGGVIIAWNVFQHFYPYFDQVRVDWDGVLSRALEKTLADKTDDDFAATLKSMVAALQDGHGDVIYQKPAPETGPPFVVAWVEDSVVIAKSSDPANFKPGDVILALDGRPADDIVKESGRLLSGSTQWKEHKFSWTFGYGPAGSTAKVLIRRDGQELETSFVRPPSPRFEPPAGPGLRELAVGVYYIDLSVATWNEIAANLSDIAVAKGVVFDLRGYPNGNHQVLSHLLKTPDTSRAWMKIPQIIAPDHDSSLTYLDLGWGLAALSPGIRGRVVFLTNGRAISYAESVMGFVEHYKLGEIIGEPTAGANGNVNVISLPGGFRITWTGMRVVKHDGSQHHTIGIRPTIPLRPTIRGIREGRDELLEKALETIGR